MPSQTSWWSQYGWGDELAFRVPVYVLTYRQRGSVEMARGTTFHFVRSPPQEVLAQATADARGKDVRVGGGVSTVRAFLKAGLVDRLRVAIVPSVLGRGITLWADLRGLEDGCDVITETAESGIVHGRVGLAHPAVGDLLA